MNHEWPRQRAADENAPMFEQSHGVRVDDLIAYYTETSAGLTELLQDIAVEEPLVEAVLGILKKPSPLTEDEARLRRVIGEFATQTAEFVA